MNAQCLVATLTRAALAISEKALGPAIRTLRRRSTTWLCSTPIKAPIPSRSTSDRWRSAKALGPGHPGVTVSLNNLAELYREQGRYADASRWWGVVPT
jgi:hypothetical protein